MVCYRETANIIREMSGWKRSAILSILLKYSVYQKKPSHHSSHLSYRKGNRLCPHKLGAEHVVVTSGVCTSEESHGELRIYCTILADRFILFFNNLQCYRNLACPNNSLQKFESDLLKVCFWIQAYFGAPSTIIEIIFLVVKRCN